MFRPRYLSVYSVTRHYGGPEEGGWWWNRYALISTFRTPRTLLKRRNILKFRIYTEQLKARFIHLEEGNIYSSLGGTEIAVCAEQYPTEHRTTHIPHYE